MGTEMLLTSENTHLNCQIAKASYQLPFHLFHQVRTVDLVPHHFLLNIFIARMLYMLFVSFAIAT